MTGIDQANEMIRDNLRRCCRDSVDFSNTGIVPDGRFREVIDLLEDAGIHNPVLMAESLLNSRAKEFIAAMP